ncbi:hypothetical protein [Bradyrhizobium sp. 174]|uniref:hypothetical protein n=1 Tax=Bradyrhizobium sp. 174 TaxID=2782645 RepID=UPI001FF93D25|nr:hypothetical protein [Bradyrhizobium sp. 174]MCK1570114.1 hypothetical protein [Bradyrhizobium sp. 174]
MYIHARYGEDGIDGIIEFDTFGDSYTVVASGKDRAEVHVEPFVEKPNQRHLDRLADQIESGEFDYSIPDQSLKALQIVEAAYLSRRYSRLISLPLPRAYCAARRIGILGHHSTALMVGAMGVSSSVDM